MKIGFISTAFPQDIDRFVLGIHQRAGMFIEAMRDLGQLHMLYYVNGHVSVSDQYVAEMEKKLRSRWNADVHLMLCRFKPIQTSDGWFEYYLRPALSLYNNPLYGRLSGCEQTQAIEKLVSQKPDILFAHRLGSMCALMRTRRIDAPVYFDLDDIEHKAFIRSLKLPPNWPGKNLLYSQVPALLLTERAAIKRSKKTFVCSEYDRKYLEKKWHLKNVVAIPNAVRIPDEQTLAERANLLFLGTFGYQPNVAAANYLIEKIWPTIRSAVPAARLLIAGEKPEQINAYKMKPPGGEFCGFVERLDALYRDVRVVCCPILTGGGTRIKILEAAAFGKPVVSTRIGAEGLDFTDGREIFLSGVAESFAQHCILLLSDYKLAAGIGRAARDRCIRMFDKSEIVPVIKRELHFGSLQ
jgi:glycosyltransferase involved in cell wall biosynthesis